MTVEEGHMLVLLLVMAGDIIWLASRLVAVVWLVLRLVTFV